MEKHKRIVKYCRWCEKPLGKKLYCENCFLPIKNTMTKKQVKSYFKKIGIKW